MTKQEQDVDTAGHGTNVPVGEPDNVTDMMLDAGYAALCEAGLRDVSSSD